MAKTEKPEAGKMPKGGRKGGTTFPRLSLQQALPYSDKLVSKTHTGPLPEATILPGVFDNVGTDGQVRASALKQFGLMEGDKTAYKATELAKAIDAALPNEKPSLLRKAVLSSKLFQEIFDTFQDDTVSRAKIRQRAQALNVHPDSADKCAEIFMESAETAGLGNVNGENILLIKAGDVSASAVLSVPADEPEHAGEPELEVPTEGAAAKSDTDKVVAGAARGINPGVVLNLNVDSSSDPDKLRKQLELLRQFKLI